MKAFKTIVLFMIMSLLGASESEAQIWKKIKDKTKSQVEDRVSDKISERISDAVIDKIDVQLTSPNNPYGHSIRSEKPDNLPESYSFNRRFKMKITNAGMDEEIYINYFMTSKGNFIGYEIPESEGMFMIMDGDIRTNISYMTQDKNKMALTYTFPEELNRTNDEEGNNKELVITDLPSKTILGYKAQGKQIESEESTMVMYYTNEIEMSFSGMFPSFKNNEMTPSYNYPEDMKNASILYIEVTDNESGDTFLMEGIKIDKSDRVVINKDYQFF